MAFLVTRPNHYPVDRRVLHGALSRLEPCAVKIACTVLRGRGGSNATLLPDYQPSLRSPWLAALEILHHSLPYGDSREAGPAFVAYSRQRSIFDLMLGRMFLADTEGHYDHLMDCTRAVSGAFNVAPSLDRLESLTT